MGQERDLSLLSPLLCWTVIHNATPRASDLAKYLTPVSCYLEGTYRGSNFCMLGLKELRTSPTRCIPCCCVSQERPCPNGWTSAVPCCLSPCLWRVQKYKVDKVKEVQCWRDSMARALCSLYLQLFSMFLGVGRSHFPEWFFLENALSSTSESSVGRLSKTEFRQRALFWRVSFHPSTVLSICISSDDNRHF